MTTGFPNPPLDEPFENPFAYLSDPNQVLTQKQWEEAQLQILAFADQLLISGAHTTWCTGLRNRFGYDIGEQLANQEVKVGMTLEHLTASFGLANQLEEDGPVTTHVYGNKKTGSYFELQDGVITAAHIKGLPLPPVPVDTPAAPDAAY